jgi:hypothetical protein
MISSIILYLSITCGLIVLLDKFLLKRKLLIKLAVLLHLTPAQEVALETAEDIAAAIAAEKLRQALLQAKKDEDAKVKLPEDK